MAASSATPDSNPSYARLSRDLGEDFELLQYLPYKRATFQSQSEVNDAAPYRILYGDMMEEKDQLWVYFTLLKADARKNAGPDSNRMISFYTLKGAKAGENPVRPAKIKEVALPSAPFKHAANHYIIMSIAKYFFIRRGIDSQLRFPLEVRPFQKDLLQACKDYREIYRQSQVVKNGTPSIGDAVDPTNSSLAMRAPPQRSSVEASRKRTHSSVSRHGSHSEYHRHSSLLPDRLPDSVASERFSTVDRETIKERYVTLQSREEELNSIFSVTEQERGAIATQVAQLQADLDVATARMEDMEQEKAGIVEEKERLQRSLHQDEWLRFGLEVGQQMERKKLRKE